MIFLSLSALVLGFAMHAEAAQAPAPLPVTEVMALVTPRPGPFPPEGTKLIPDEVNGVVRLYLEGKIEQWYSRADGKGAILFLRAKTEEEARAILSVLPFVKNGYLSVEYVPVGPMKSLGFLLAPQQGGGPDPR